jgi:hypothetical protein
MLQIVVVPNIVADQKVPPAIGLMKYRKDNEKLYVRSNETWKVICEEEKVTCNYFISRTRISILYQGLYYFRTLQYDSFVQY